MTSNQENGLRLLRCSRSHRERFALRAFWPEVPERSLLLEPTDEFLDAVEEFISSRAYSEDFLFQENDTLLIVGRNVTSALAQAVLAAHPGRDVISSLHIHNDIGWEGDAVDFLSATAVLRYDKLASSWNDLQLPDTGLDLLPLHIQRRALRSFCRKHGDLFPAKMDAGGRTISRIHYESSRVTPEHIDTEVRDAERYFAGRLDALSWFREAGTVRHSAQIISRALREMDASGLRHDDIPTASEVVSYAIRAAICREASDAVPRATLIQIQSVMIQVGRQGVFDGLFAALPLTDDDIDSVQAGPVNLEAMMGTTDRMFDVEEKIDWVEALLVCILGPDLIARISTVLTDPDAAPRESVRSRLDYLSAASLEQQP